MKEIEIINELLKGIEDNLNTLQEINKLVAASSNKMVNIMSKVKELTNE